MLARTTYEFEVEFFIVSEPYRNLNGKVWLTYSTAAVQWQYGGAVSMSFKYAKISRVSTVQEMLRYIHADEKLKQFSLPSARKEIAPQFKLESTPSLTSRSPSN